MSAAIANAAGRPAFRWGMWLAIVVMVLVCLFPIWWVVVSALTPKALLLSSPPRYLPTNVTLGNFVSLFQQFDVLAALTNSIILSVVSTTVSVALSYLAAYAFARYTFPGSTVLFILLLMSSALPPIATVIPLFKQFGEMGLTDTLLGLEILIASAIAPFTVWILTHFIRRVPIEIEEAARMDGAGLFLIITRVTGPLTLPAIGTMFVINFITSWNELFFPLIFAQTPATQPLSLGLLNLSSSVANAGKPWDQISALTVLMIIPIIVVVLAFEPFITRGLSLGSEK